MTMGQEMPTAPDYTHTAYNESLYDHPFLVPKPIHHSPKISPSSIPNPSPSVTTNRLIDSGYPNYGGYLYSIPGYSAFQPVSYPGIVHPTQAPIPMMNLNNTPPMVNLNNTPPIVNLNNTPLPTADVIEEKAPEENLEYIKVTDEVDEEPPVTVTTAEVKMIESKMSITSLSQGSGATVTIPVQNPVSEMKPKSERFSLKTSIPISKIDMKCVNNQPELFQKKPSVFNPAFAKTEHSPRVAIQSNIIIKPPTKEPENKESKPVVHNNSISTLLNAAEAINKGDMQFRVPEAKTESKEVAEPTPTLKPSFSSVNIDNKVSLPSKTSETTPHQEQKNQILLIQNKNANSKMLLTIQQQNPQVLLKRTNFDSKNLQTPSRLSNQSKRSKDEDNTSSKVVALKRCHQDNCDENDFENLITENQIYGNKIVVKEKLQGTQQEQDLKTKKVEKQSTSEAKNVVLQPNFLYLSNVQFPTNLMMIKNNNKSNNESKVSSETKSTEIKVNTTEMGPPKPVVSETYASKSKSNSALQTVTSKSKTDLLSQKNPKMVMNPHIVYQVPMVISTDNNQEKNQPYKRELPKIISQPKHYPKPTEQKKEKVFLACPYQADSKLQPKILITNIRPSIPKVEENSVLDLYEKRRRLKRLKHLSNKDHKEVKNELRNELKNEIKKTQDSLKNVITPDKMDYEIYKEFASTKMKVDEETAESDSDYDEDMKEYESIIDEYGESIDTEKEKENFLVNLNLSTRDLYKDQQVELLNRIRTAAKASKHEKLPTKSSKHANVLLKESKSQVSDNLEKEDEVTYKKKRLFLAQLKLRSVSQRYKDGYERLWKGVLRERRRREGIEDKEDDIFKKPSITIDSTDPLQLLTEINKSVSENNNLIMKRLHLADHNVNQESIDVLAEKNFSELTRLANMAGRSVTVLGASEPKKFDINPSFDGENIRIHITIKERITVPKIHAPRRYSLKPIMDAAMATTPATSMDEPVNSAAGVTEIQEISQTEPEAVEETMPEIVIDLIPQIPKEVVPTEDKCEQTLDWEPEPLWPGLEVIVNFYNDYETVRKKEIAELRRRNEILKVDCTQTEGATSRESERARSLLKEIQNLAVAENNTLLSLNRLYNAINFLKES